MSQSLRYATLTDKPNLNRTTSIVLMDYGSTLYKAEPKDNAQFWQWNDLSDLTPRDAMSILQPIADGLQMHRDNP